MYRGPDDTDQKREAQAEAQEIQRFVQQMGTNRSPLQMVLTAIVATIGFVQVLVVVGYSLIALALFVLSWELGGEERDEGPFYVPPVPGMDASGGND